MGEEGVRGGRRETCAQSCDTVEGKCGRPGLGAAAQGSLGTDPLGWHLHPAGASHRESLPAQLWDVHPARAKVGYSPSPQQALTGTRGSEGPDSLCPRDPGSSLLWRGLG